MGFINAIDQWLEKKNEKRIALSKSQGICPECQGKGFNMVGTEVYITNSYYDCPGCNGSGSFADWLETN
ncbi:methionine aminopeptidase [Halalkalibacter kiskunsagensis]|uniref:Methionine aminopeptidase n=1 Tax=Halalkalibacter kiskunsagensis TaxID=1548599 RepID=A0ABV6KGA3_9BACI